MLRANLNEVNVEPVDFRDELRQRIELRFNFPPVVTRMPVIRESLHRHELHALRRIVDCLALGPSGSADAALHIDKLSFGHVNTKRANGSIWRADWSRDFGDRVSRFGESDPAQCTGRACRDRHADKTTARRRQRKIIGWHTNSYPATDRASRCRATSCVKGEKTFIGR